MQHMRFRTRPIARVDKSFVWMLVLPLLACGGGNGSAGPTDAAFLAEGAAHADAVTCAGDAGRADAPSHGGDAGRTDGPSRTGDTGRGFDVSPGSLGDGPAVVSVDGATPDAPAMACTNEGSNCGPFMTGFCCGGACRTDTDPNNCGGCGVVCSGNNIPTRTSSLGRRRARRNRSRVARSGMLRQ